MDKHTTEAPFSITYKLMYREVELLITDRTEQQPLEDGKPWVSNVTRQLGKAMQDIDWAMGTQKFTAPPQRGSGGFPKKEPEYVPNRQCPVCGSRLVYATKKDGSRYMKCENNKWDRNQGRAIGCQFVDWGNQQQQHPVQSVQNIPVRDINNDYGEYQG